MLTSLIKGAALAVLISGLAVPAFAADSSDLAAFNAFGGKAGIAKVANNGVDQVLQDPRIKDYFAHADIPRLKAALAEQFCMLLGGPCTYSGPDMKSAHAGMKLRDAQFNALAEDFQIAMTGLDIPFYWQNKLVAKLAPMERDITTH
jgi:hemoglobin